MNIQSEAGAALLSAWPRIIEETRLVLGSELHYQAMVYHCLRLYGQIPLSQIGMNVKMWIANPVSPLFQQLDRRKNELYHGGFEPIPDVCLFSEAVSADWRRRSYENTMAALLLAIEVKASERAGGRLRLGEIKRDILKLQAHRQEAQARNHDFIPVMMVIDTAPSLQERMTQESFAGSQSAAREAGVEFFYVSQDRDFCSMKKMISIESAAIPSSTVKPHRRPR